MCGKRARHPRLLRPVEQLLDGERYVHQSKVNAKAGRDHWNFCYSRMMVGGGFRSGLIYGRSDPIGGFPAADPLVPGDIISTLFGCLGIAHNGEIHDRLDRPYRIVPAGDPQPQLLM